jgi:hypothetical protein
VINTGVLRQKRIPSNQLILPLDDRRLVSPC